MFYQTDYTAVAPSPPTVGWHRAPAVEHDSITSMGTVLRTVLTSCIS